MKKETRRCSHCKRVGIPLMVQARIGGKTYYHCRDCNSDRVRRYRSTEVGREKTRKAVYASIARHPERQAARILLNCAVRAGKIVRPERCSRCGELKKVDGHHKDYSRPLEVVWLCRQCHADEEVKNKK